MRVGPHRICLFGIRHCVLADRQFIVRPQFRTLRIVGIRIGFRPTWKLLIFAILCSVELCCFSFGFRPCWQYFVGAVLRSSVVLCVLIRTRSIRILRFRPRFRPCRKFLIATILHAPRIFPRSPRLSPHWQFPIYPQFRPSWILHFRLRMCFGYFRNAQDVYC